MQECPIGTYKDVGGSDERLCTPCSLDLLPNRANFIYVRGNIDNCNLTINQKLSLNFFWANISLEGSLSSGGVSQPSCPYKCISDKYRMPSCYTPLEELIYTFGGLWPFALLLSCILVFLALFLNTLRIKVVGSSSYHRENSIEHHSHRHFPYLLSLSEVHW